MAGMMGKQVEITPGLERLVTEALAWHHAFGTGRLWQHVLAALNGSRATHASQDAGRQLLAIEVPDRARLVDGVAETRAKQLRLLNLYPSAAAAGLAGGRLLLFAPDDSLSDGAAAIASEGLFDRHNVPPAETWLYNAIDRERTAHSRRQQRQAARFGGWYPPGHTSYVVCWIAGDLLSRAEAGIAANAEGCLRWADDVSGSLSMSEKAART